MPVTFQVSSNVARHIDKKDAIISTSPANALKRAAPNPAKNYGELLQSSIADSELPKLVANTNGFVYTCIQAYNDHQNLIIRPDDIWMCILTQFSFYVNKHSEEMEEYFVSHKDGKKELEIMAIGNRYTVDFGAMATQMTDLLQVRYPISVYFP